MVHDIGAYHSNGESILFFHYGINVLILAITISIVGDSVSFYAALKEERHKAELAHRKSMTDTLTGVFNRRVIPKIDSQTWDHYSLLLINMDHFKDFNDKNGHFCGDQILKAVVNICRQIIREEDYCIRLGGDEFVLFLPHCREEGALNIAEDLRARIGDTEITIENRQVSCTCSIGISEHEKENITNALKLTNRALNRAKNTRDTISL